MAEYCQNCNEVIEGNFCSNCGQKKFKRIGRKYIWEEIQYTLLHTNKGFLYSVKNLLKNPGKTAKSYIDGDRVNHYKPMLLVFVLSGISTFISFKLLNIKEMMHIYFSEQHADSKFMADFSTFMSSYTSIMMLLMVPVFAFTTKVAFRKWGHNYYEHIVMNAYILSFYTILSIVVFYPIMFAFRHSPHTFMTISQLSMVSVIFILIWFFKTFYPEKPLKSIVLRSFGSLGVFLALYLFLIVIGVVITLVIMLTKGTEGLQYIKPK